MSNHEHSTAYVGVHPSATYGTLVYVIVDGRAAFDAIGLPVFSQSEEVITKNLEQGNGSETVRIVFQHWLSRASMAQSDAA